MNEPAPLPAPLLDPRPLPVYRAAPWWWPFGRARAGETAWTDGPAPSAVDAELVRVRLEAVAAKPVEVLCGHVFEGQTCTLAPHEGGWHANEHYTWP